MWEEKTAYELFMGKSEGNRPLSKPGCRWMDNIKMNLGEREFRSKDWIDVVRDRDQ
jgi:hypothetical protein